MSLYDSATLVYAGGLNNLSEYVINSWVGPLFIAAVAVFAVIFIKDRSWTKLIGLVGIAAVVSVLVFGGQTFFSDGGTFNNVAEKAGKKIQ